MKKNKYMMLPVLLAAAAVFCAAQGASAMHTFVSAVTNHAQMGNVRIGLKEFALNEDGKKEEFLNHQLVVPGQTISKIPVITNKGAPVYVRAKVSFENLSADVEKQDEIFLADSGCLNEISSRWLKIGDYYYYRDVLNTGENIELFQSVTFPEHFTEDSSGQKTGIFIQADAIQADNFMPDFDSQQPWNDEKILESVKEGDGDFLFRQKQYQNLSVTFNKTASELLSAPDDFFVNLKDLMPGDELQDQINLNNQSGKYVKLSFSARNSELLSDIQKTLMDKIQFTISCREEILFSGKLSSEILEKGIVLGNFKGRTSADLDFKITVPKELDNTYALENCETQWVFTAQYNDTPNDVIQVPKTSDFLWKSLICFGSAGILGAGVGYLSCKRKKGGFCENKR